jgi:hypothetical protein
MTWLQGLPEGDDDWERLGALCPEVVEALAGVVAVASGDTDPVLFELARLRIATLLANTAEPSARVAELADVGLTEAKALELSNWVTSEAFTERERACLALVEQFVIDAHAVTEAQVVAVTGHLGGPGCYAFVEAVSVLETFQRGCLTLGLRSVPSIETLISAAPSPS